MQSTAEQNSPNGCLSLWTSLGGRKVQAYAAAPSEEQLGIIILKTMQEYPPRGYETKVTTQGKAWEVANWIVEINYAEADWPACTITRYLTCN